MRDDVKRNVLGEGRDDLRRNVFVKQCNLLGRQRLRPPVAIFHSINSSSSISSNGFGGRGPPKARLKTGTKTTPKRIKTGATNLERGGEEQVSQAPRSCRKITPLIPAAAAFAFVAADVFGRKTWLRLRQRRLHGLWKVGR